MPVYYIYISPPRLGFGPGPFRPGNAGNGYGCCFSLYLATSEFENRSTPTPLSKWKSMAPHGHATHHASLLFENGPSVQPHFSLRLAFRFLKFGTSQLHVGDTVPPVTPRRVSSFDHLRLLGPYLFREFMCPWLLALVFWLPSGPSFSIGVRYSKAQVMTSALTFANIPSELDLNRALCPLNFLSVVPRMGHCTNHLCGVAPFYRNADSGRGCTRRC